MKQITESLALEWLRLTDSAIELVRYLRQSGLDYDDIEDLLRVVLPVYFRELLGEKPSAINNQAKHIQSLRNEGKQPAICLVRTENGEYVERHNI